MVKKMERRASAVAAVVLVAAILALPGSSRASERGGSATVLARTSQAAALDDGLLTDLNRIRLDHGLTPLTPSPGLAAAATAHSEDMIAKGYFSHSSANGLPFWKRIARYYPLTRYESWSVGENLLWSSGRIDAAAGLAAWMASPLHRANILSPSWRQIGIAAVSSPAAPGTYRGLSVTVITTDFGVRR